MHGCGRMGSVFNRNRWATYGKKKKKVGGFGKQMDRWTPFCSPIHPLSAHEEIK